MEVNEVFVHATPTYVPDMDNIIETFSRLFRIHLLTDKDDIDIEIPLFAKAGIGKWSKIRKKNYKYQ